MENIKQKLEKVFSFEFWEDVLAAILRPLVLVFMKINQWRKHNKKRFRIVILSAAAVAVLAGGFFGFWRYQKYQKENPFGVWETLVVLRSQEGAASDEEDAKNNLKRGDVTAVRAAGHSWSQAEYKSYLLVKIEGRKNEVEKLLEPLEKDVEKKDGQEQPEREVIRLRRYQLNLDKIGFSGDQVVSGQPVEDKIFQAEEVIREK